MDYSKKIRKEACIDETTLLKLWELDRQGISIKISDPWLGADFLEFSRRSLSERVDLQDFLNE